MMHNILKNALFLSAILLAVTIGNSYASMPLNTESPCWLIAEESREACWKKESASQRIDEEKMAGIAKYMNYCESNEDCILANYSCSYGCKVPINAKYSETLEKITADFRKRYGACKIECATYMKKLVCINQACQSTTAK